MKKYFKQLLSLIMLSALANTILAQSKELSLQEALNIAAKGNRQLQIQTLQSQKASEALKEAKSYLLPSVNANSGYTIYGERPVAWFRNETGSSKVNDIKIGGRFAFDAGITASYPLLNPSLTSTIRTAGINELISKEQVKNAEEQLALEISALYLAVLMKQEQLKVLEQSLQRNERSLKDSRSLFLQGKNLKTDTLSNYISVQNLKANIAAIKNNIDVLSVQLRQLMGMDNAVSFVFTDSLIPANGENRFQTSSAGLSIAIDNRKDIKIQALHIDLAKEQLQFEKAEFKPKLSAVAQYQVQSQSDHLKVWDYGLPRTSFVGVRLSVPIFSGHRQKYKTKQAELSIKANETAMTELKSSVQTELISLNANMQDAYDQWLIQDQNVEAAKINYTMMNDRYRYGLGNRLELTDAELAYTKAKLDQLQAVYSIRIIELQLKKAMGLLGLN